MQLLIDLLVEQGVTDFFVSPGSRNSPLIIAATRNPKVNLHRHFDERGLGFFALGFALATKRPVAVVVTSGTAVGNLMPAVMEASHASIPLILLTADRPPELRDAAANQASDQVKMFSNFVRFQFDLDPTMPPKAIASKIAQGVFNSLWPHPGPIQINCPLREPLYPLASAPQIPSLLFQIAPLSALPPLQLPARGVILVGRLPSHSDLFAVLKLAQKLKWPVFADILSEARLYPTAEQIAHFDRMDLMADCVLHFGERLTSKKMETFRAPRYIHVSPYPQWIDPFHAVTERIVTNIESFQANAPIDEEWLSFWKQKDQFLEELISEALEEAPHTESALVANLSQLPLENHAVFFANSMPIREANWFFRPSRCKAFFANRGLSGIDGNIATIAGIAEHFPTLAILGDLTTLHDLNSLALLKNSKHPISLIVLNNQGGGIFSHLAFSQDPAAPSFIVYEHSFGFEAAARMFHIPYAHSQLPSLAQSEIIEWTTSRSENYLFHSKLKNRINTELITSNK